MPLSFRERFLIWICTTFWHNPDIDNIWEHEDETYATCKGCNRIIVARYDPMYGSTDWEYPPV